mmetsp:Transcript_517/g.1183  ORF Transcript_517/g.1183 Transcript_517/m.1183 type:complete len:115 (+) Transcript_517:104-448(+)
MLRVTVIMAILGLSLAGEVLQGATWKQNSQKSLLGRHHGRVAKPAKAPAHHAKHGPSHEVNSGSFAQVHGDQSGTAATESNAKGVVIDVRLNSQLQLAGHAKRVVNGNPSEKPN